MRYHGIMVRAFRRPVLVTLLLVVAAAGEPTRAQTSLSSRVYVSGLSAPVAFVQDPTNNAVQFVVEQAGRIRAPRIAITRPSPHCGQYRKSVGSPGISGEPAARRS